MALETVIPGRFLDCPAAEVDCELARRSRTGALAYVVILSLFGAVTSFPFLRPQGFWVMMGAAVSLGICRLLLVQQYSQVRERAPQVWRFLFRLTTGAMALCWGIFCLYCISQFHWEWTTLVLLMMTAGAASGAAITLCPDLRLALIYLICMLGPIVIAGSWDRTHGSLGIALTMAVYLGYPCIQTVQQHRSYRDGVLARLRAEAAEAAALQSESRFRKIFHGNSLPAWVFDRETLRFLEVNDAASRHYGYSRDEFLGMSISKPVHAQKLHEILDTVSASLNPPQQPVTASISPAESAARFQARAAIERMGGDAGLFHEVLELFFKQCPLLLGDLHAALEAQDLRLLRRTAHMLRGSLNQLGGRLAGETAFRVEAAGEDGDLQRASRDCVELESQISKLLPEMQRWVVENAHESCRR